MKAWLTDFENAATIRPIPTTATAVIPPTNTAAQIDPWLLNPSTIATANVSRRDTTPRSIVGRLIPISNSEAFIGVICSLRSVPASTSPVMVIETINTNITTEMIRMPGIYRSNSDRPAEPPKDISLN